MLRLSNTTLCRHFHGTTVSFRAYPLGVPANAEVKTAIEAARREIFGIVTGNGLRSGRKILRSHLKGPQIAGYYPPSIRDMPLEAIGIEAPKREELYRKEEQMNRLGKTRIKGKMRGGTAEFQDKMRFREITPAAMESLDIVDSSIALPDQQILDAMQLGKTEEERGWLKELFANFAVSLEKPATLTAAGAGGVSKGIGSGVSRETKAASKLARASKMRQGYADKRLFGAGESGSGDSRGSSSKGGVGSDSDMGDSDLESSRAEAEVPRGRGSRGSLDAEEQKLLDGIDRVMAVRIRLSVEQALAADPSLAANLPDGGLDALPYSQLKALALKAGILTAVEEAPGLRGFAGFGGAGGGFSRARASSNDDESDDESDVGPADSTGSKHE